MKLELKYGHLKQDIKQLFKNLMWDVDSIVLKDNGILKLKDFLVKLGIKSEITDEKKFTIIINKKPNIFEKNLLEILDYRICSACGKFTHSPIRNIAKDCYYPYSTYGEKFSHEHKPFCKKCFQPILEQWVNQLKDIRDRWVKKEQPDWKKTETGYIDKEGKEYPLENWTPDWIKKGGER